MGVWPPIDLAEVAANIRDGNNKVFLLDSVVHGYSFDAMFSKILKYNPDVLILQDTTPTIRYDLEIVKKLKEEIPKLTTIFFGLYSTVMPNDVLRSDGVSFVIKNEPEITIKELIDFLNGKGKLEEILGLSYLKEGRVFHNKERRALEDLDSLPFPARDLIDNNKYILPMTAEPFTIIKTSRGCPYRCIFCTSSLYYKNAWRTRSPRNIINEIKEVIHSYGIKNFIFISDTFNLKKEFVLNLCYLIQSESIKIKWACNSRVDRFTEELSTVMKNAGCWLVSFGVESGSNKILNNIKKQTTIEQAREAIGHAKKAGIRSLCYFIFGLPGEDKDTIRDTIKFAKELDPDYVHFYTATPFPGTEFYEIARDNKWLISYDWERYLLGASDVISYPDLSSREIFQSVVKAYRSFYLQPKIARRQLGFIRSRRQLIGTLKTGSRMLFNNLFPIQ